MNKKNSKEREQKSKRYERLQGNEWDAVKDNMKLLYVYTSEKGNIKGIYTNGKERVSHWMTEEEKEKYLANKKEEN